MENPIKIKGHHLSLLADELIEYERLKEIQDPNDYLQDFQRRIKGNVSDSLTRIPQRRLLEYIVTNFDQDVMIIKGLDGDPICTACTKEKEDGCFSGGWEDEFTAREYGLDFDRPYKSRIILLILLDYALKNAINDPLRRYLCPRDNVFGIG